MSDSPSEEIKAYINGLEIHIANYISDNARLKAEVERLNDSIMCGALIPDAKPTE